MSYKKLIVYQKSYNLAMKIFEVSKTFPLIEKYSLTDQIRRSSRSVCTNLAEAYRKRRYPAHFTSKVTDADMENSETLVWLDFALSCQYLEVSQYNLLVEQNHEIGRLLNHMLRNTTNYAER